MTKDRRQQYDDSVGVSHKQPPVHAAESSSGLFLTVLFTTVPETLAALRRAAVLASELAARIRIFVPYVVPHPLPLECPQADPNFRVRQFRTLCEQEPIETRIDIKLCRDVRECLLQELAPRSLVIIGVKRRWPFRGPVRLAKSLQDGGHHVLFARQVRSRLGSFERTCLLAGIFLLVALPFIVL